MSYESRIDADISVLRKNLEQLRDDTTTDKHDDHHSELQKLQLVNKLLRSLSDTIDTIDANVKRVDEGLKVTNELIDRWAKILLKNGEISSLLFSDGTGDKYRWNGSTLDNEAYRARAEEYNVLVERYTRLKAAKDEKERKTKEQEHQRIKRIKEREQSLQRRVYGTRTSRGRVEKKR